MRLGITDAVKHLIIINVVMFIGTLSIGGGELFYRLFGLYFPENELFKLWQLMTHMFMHGDQSHIFFNMLLLFLVGVHVEYALGTKRFVFLYLSAGLGGALLTLLIDYIQFTIITKEIIDAGFLKHDIYNLVSQGMYDKRWEDVVGFDSIKKLLLDFNKLSIGASGAITGILAVYGLMFPNNEVFLLFPPIRLKVKYLVVGIIGSDFISAILTGTPLLGSSNIGYVAHIGGAITGLIIYLFWRKNSMDRYRWN